jgi:hypothetical protein
VKRVGLDIAGIKGWGLIHMDNIFSKFTVGWELVSADKALWIKVFPSSGISPVNRNGMDMKRIYQLLCGPSRSAGVFKGQIEPIVLQPPHL